MPDEEKFVEERKQKLINFFSKRKNILVIVGLVLLLALTWYIRTVNVPSLKDITTNEYTLGPDLDPFLFLRYAKTIVENGSLPEIDKMRYVPLGFNTAEESRVLPYMIAYFHKALNFFTNASVNYSAVLFPAFMFLLTAFVFFLMTRKIFQEHWYKDIVALISTAFLIVAPSLLARTVAGIPEKESAGFFFMFLAFYFFLLSWRSEKIWKGLSFAFLSGLSTALMGLIWGGWVYVLTSITVFAFVMFILGKLAKKEFLYYSMWVIVSLGVYFVFFAARYGIMTILTSTSSGLCFIVFILFLVDFLIFETKLKNISIIEKLRKKLPDKVISIIIFLIVGFIFFSLFFGISFVPNFVNDIIFHLTQPYSSRLSFTVAENRQPYFSEWGESFGPIIANIPLLFWLFFAGSIFLFYKAVENLEKRGKIILTLTYIIFLFALIFSRYSSSSIMNGTNNISKIIYFGGFILIAVSSCYLLFKYYKQNSLDELKKINSSYLFLIILFFVCLIGARSAVRLIMVLAVPSAIITSYFCIAVFEQARERKDETLRLIFIVIAALVILASLYSLYYNYQVTLAGAKGMAPSAYTQQWQKAMAWVRDNTPKDAVFAHWWDYGYWVQTIGNRATVLDGGNVIAYWDHLIGRHVLTGQSEAEALEFLYTHNSTHLLIDSTDIGKYPAYSSIGSDENYDRYSQMSIFIQDEKNIQETKNETVYLYSGGAALDKDYLWTDIETGKQEFLPAFKTGIAGVFLRITKNGEMAQPSVVFIYNNKQYVSGLGCVYYKGQTFEFNQGYKGCLYTVPKLTQTSSGFGLNDKGAALFITEKSMNALWVKLYLFDKTENFKLVHKEDDIIVSNLKQQNASIGDFVVYGDIRGPIKIWEINYPPGTKVNQEYLSTIYPDTVKIAKANF